MNEEKQKTMTRSITCSLCNRVSFRLLSPFFTFGFVLKPKESKSRKKLIIPFKEVCVFGGADDSTSHHNCLEALSLDCPKFAVSDSGDGSSSLTVV